MRVVLRRRLRDSRAAGQYVYRQTVFNVDRFTIGRGAEQLIQVPDARIGVAHAVIEHYKGEFRVRALTEAPITVNGTARRTSSLRVSDVILLADRRLTVENIRPDGVIVLRLGLPVDGAVEEDVTPDAQMLKEAGIRAGPPSRLIVLGVVLFALLAPLLTAWDTPFREQLRATTMFPGDATWMPGPLHKAHQAIGGNCNACHAAPFERVSNKACGTCHPGTQHHVPFDSPARARFSDMRCTDCHVEHSKPSQLVDTDSRECVACHGNLKELASQTTLHDVTDFGTDHADFSLSMLEPTNDGTSPQWRTNFVDSSFRPRPEEHSNLKFSHEVHLNKHGIKSPIGDQVLMCGDCHQPDASGRHMEPVRMESHCARCHSLLFDEHDPATAVPHGALKPMFTALQEHFSRMFLQPGTHGDRQLERRRPGGESAVMTRDEQRRAFEWTTRESLRAAQELLERRVCVECHTVTRLANKSGFDQWRIEPVKLASSWMPRAQFNHAAHRSSACTACHGSAERSRRSADVLMPGIKECRGCHGGSHAKTQLASGCTMCHKLHLPGRGEYVSPGPPASAPVSATAREGK